jgi:3''-Phosphoadenosine 5''-phosphosulfate (PAPS) 3''-phosphatase
MNKKDLVSITDELIHTFKFAGETALQLRKQGLKINNKDDNTPVSNGDMSVNEILTTKIEKLTPGVPIVSEESSSNKSVENLKNFWLIDPIDGTYDYINNRNEFTINAALIIKQKPVWGMINAPALDRLFFTLGPEANEIRGKEFIKLTCEKKSKQNEVKAVAYSENLKPDIIELHKKYGVTEYKKMKSSLKFCVIAAGEFDFYVAEPRASEWDIAAGHAILEHAGGIITDFENNKILYGKKDFKNPGLILRRSTNL